MKELRFTLYEVLGYLFPGTVVFAAIVIVLWGLLWPNFQLDALNRVSLRQLAVLAIFIYLLGHLAQAMANWVDRFIENRLGANCNGLTAKIVRGLKWAFLEKNIDQTKQGALPKGIMDRVRDEVADYYKIERLKPDDDITLNRLCDAAVVMTGAPEDREIYIYREGFYRGMWFGLVLTSLALLFPFIRQLVCRDIHMWTDPLIPSWVILGLFALASFKCSCFAYGRYWRFRNYRVEGAFLFFLSVSKKKQSSTT